MRPRNRLIGRIGINRSIVVASWSKSELQSGEPSYYIYICIIFISQKAAAKNISKDQNILIIFNNTILLF